LRLGLICELSKQLALGGVRLHCTHESKATLLSVLVFMGHLSLGAFPLSPLDVASCTSTR
jgi:hypothetical protein